MFESLSIGHLLVVLVIFLLLFGAKRIPEIAGSLGQGIQSFKKSMTLDDTPAPPSQIASKDSVPLPNARPSDSTAMAQSDDIVREPKRLF
jgi:sec-independent protein translocase protein TatA